MSPRSFLVRLVVGRLLVRTVTCENAARAEAIARYSFEAFGAGEFCPDRERVIEAEIEEVAS